MIFSPKRVCFGWKNVVRCLCVLTNLSVSFQLGEKYGVNTWIFLRSERLFQSLIVTRFKNVGVFVRKTKIQATPAMSTSRISIIPLMSKWFFIPNIFSLYFFAFQLRLCWKRLTRSNGYLKVIFRALDVFSIIFASVYVEVLNRHSHGRHIVCFGYVHVLAEVRTSSKQQ